MSLFDGIADWMAVPLIHREYTGREPKRLGLNHATIAPYGAYAAGDGAQFIISIQTEAEWASLCRAVLARPDMIDDPRFSTNSRRAANRAALDAEMSDGAVAFRRGRHGGGAAERQHRLRPLQYGRRICASLAVASRRGQTPERPGQRRAPPQVFDRRPVALGPSPAIGEHSEAIRREFASETEAEEIALSQSDLRAWIGRSEENRDQVYGDDAG